MAYFYLCVAIAAETIGTAALKASQGFTRPVYAVVVVLGYGIAAYFLSLTTQTIAMGIAYAIWCAAGIMAVSIFGYMFYGQTLDAAAICGIGLIIAGCGVLNLLSSSLHQ